MAQSRSDMRIGLGLLAFCALVAGRAPGPGATGITEDQGADQQPGRAHLGRQPALLPDPAQNAQILAILQKYILV